MYIIYIKFIYGYAQRHITKKRRKTKIKTQDIAIVLILIVVIVGATGGLQNLRGAGAGIDFSWLFGGAGAGTVPVNKQLDFALTDRYGGSALTSKTLLVHDGTTHEQLESLTTGADGTINTGFSYPSGTRLDVYYEDSNDKMWWDVVVPEMNEKDAEASTYNVIPLKAFAIGTYTSDSLNYANGTAIADTGNIYKSNTSTPHLTYKLANTGNDNTGLMSSHDPLYNMDFNVVFYMSFSGTGYESVLVYTFPNDYTLGTTHYVAQTIDPYKLTKHKVGWEYKSLGTNDISFWLDLSGIETGDAVTMQIYVYAYSSVAWHQAHGGNYGYEAVQLAEHTVTINP